MSRPGVRDKQQVPSRQLPSWDPNPAWAGGPRSRGGGPDGSGQTPAALSEVEEHRGQWEWVVASPPQVPGRGEAAASARREEHVDRAPDRFWG